MKHNKRYQPKELFIKRMNSLLEKGSDQENYWRIIRTSPQKSIRCNTLKISPKKLKEILEEKSWKINQPFLKQGYEEIFIVENQLEPGELGKSKEHLLGYYYIQEISSMLPIISLRPQQGDYFLDVCASPGSKTTQAAAKMKNKGVLIANDVKLSRIKILAANLEKCGVSNTLITYRTGERLCKELKEANFYFDKILVDAPCSGEGTIRSSPKTLLMWNPKMIKIFSKKQKYLASNALKILKTGGEMIYSTCTHAPEENEEVIQFLIDNFDIEILKTELPLKTRPGLNSWENKKFSEQIKKCSRIYPQDNNTEGFFVCKIKKLSDKTKDR